MYFHLKIIGVVLIALAMIHIIFPKYFNWEKELSSLSLINPKMMTIYSYFFTLTAFFISLLSLTSSNELVNTVLGKKISLGLGIFWLVRLFVQFFVYSHLHWKGKRFETTVHILFSALKETSNKRIRSSYSTVGNKGVKDAKRRK